MFHIIILLEIMISLFLPIILLHVGTNTKISFILFGFIVMFWSNSLNVDHHFSAMIELSLIVFLLLIHVIVYSDSMIRVWKNLTNNGKLIYLTWSFVNFLVILSFSAYAIYKNDGSLSSWQELFWQFAMMEAPAMLIPIVFGHFMRETLLKVDSKK